MRLICVILLISTLALLFHTAAADIDQDTDLTKPQQNDDDTSLFRGVENAIDEDSEDDAYRILKSLQDVTDDEMDEDQDFSPDSNDEDEDEEDSDLLFDDVDDEDQDEDEDDFSADLPEFKNEETADFFEHLPQQPVDNGDNKLSIVEDNIEVEEVDEEMDELAPKPDLGEDDDEEEEEQDDSNQHNENSTPTPVLPPITNENIPWNRPEPVMKVDGNSNFYQDINYKESEKVKQNPSSTSNFQFWHLFFILMVLAIVYNSITKRKPHNFIELPSSSSSLPWGNKDEKDYLPLHSNSKRNSYYKYEIKSS
ncbi:uncharacterized protein ATC70_002641 [Mucor velutinosus]|uniref:Uncharacterized protein n=1 Tax=Mucor velutinosus TaxID=708070 RepID=A0AAN7I0H5_9FUNG|nr:hypothetical protein ATC70_002641 [Mucor velutinosus]